MQLKPLTAPKNKRWQVWLKQAYFDLQASKTSLENNYCEWASYQAEQSAEKCLKALLVHSGFRPPKVHKISILVSWCNRARKEFRELNLDFDMIESYTFISRYPFLIPGEDQSPHEYVTYEDAKACVVEAQGLFQKVIKLMQ